MRFLGQNGYDFELAAAMATFEVGAILTVQDCHVSSWSHSLAFEECPNKRWNGVMFERLSREAPPLGCAGEAELSTLPGTNPKPTGREA